MKSKLILPIQLFSVKKTFLLAFLIIFSFQFSIFKLHAQRSLDLSKREPDWYTVIGGNAVSPCLDTSYGVALLSDGRLLSACTSAGNVIWQRSIRGRPSPYITSFGDFLFIVTDNSRLNFVNPSGLTLWTVTAPFPISDFPLVGRDGRVFVRGKRGIACYGLDGKRKWKADTLDLGDFQIGELNDGSLLLFLKNPKNNRSQALHYTVFGEKLEDITFTGIISSVENCEQGVLVSLKNGSVGLVSVEDGSTDSKWVGGSGNSGGSFKICYSKTSKNSAFFYQNGNKTEAVIVKTDSGEILNRFQVGAIASKDFKIARATQAGYFISGAYSACEFLEDGTILYTASLPPQKDWTSLFYTSKNYLVICFKDWTMKAYLLSQSPKASLEKESPSISYIGTVSYDQEALDLGIRPLSNQKMAEISQKFEAGDYGRDEEEYLSLLKTEAWNYINSYAMQTAFQSNEKGDFFAENAVYTQNLLYLMSKTGTREFSVLFSKLLSTQISSRELLSVITFAGKTGYDENGAMLTALEKVLMTKVQTSETTILKAISDATLEICHYMGRPALNRKGKSILTYMMRPQYDKNVQEYARKTLEKMIEFEKKR